MHIFSLGYTLKPVITIIAAVMKVMNLTQILRNLQHQMTVSHPMTAVALPVAAVVVPVVAAAAQRNPMMTTSTSQRNADK